MEMTYQVLNCYNPSVVLHGRTVYFDLCYPGVKDNPNVVEVGLDDVRAADSIQISYDFERDGWSIKQASRFSWLPDEEQDEDWQEVAFIQAWARKVPDVWED